MCITDCKSAVTRVVAVIKYIKTVYAPEQVNLVRYNYSSIASVISQPLKTTHLIVN